MITIIEEHGQRKLRSDTEDGAYIRSIRILTKEQLQAMHDSDLRRFKNKLYEMSECQFSPEAIRAFDYLRHTLRREEFYREMVEMYPDYTRERAYKRDARRCNHFGDH